ncbi:GNAT family N-acetyltransferase [Pontixanthobacter aquaemixtae]|uniref:GNAT family N-acetyltransferase n=1 Tax=Pontixanthobacter aquaemixtae TaxID=1958940 RepID=A0A844ZMY8_9SPHN|nr:GNAT family N-acetyltransferase [Pontixanthobacter aquaemixtae]MXO89741.1 GNAT family N-acetyltransferase [Pontixanthobacter aquaemixtae]
MFHRTQRLFLRPAWPEDWEAIYRGICDEGVVRNLARAPWPYEPEHARDWAKRPLDPSSPTWLITLADSGELVGCIGIDPHDGEVEVGYWIARAHWAKGFATEAGQAVLEIARMMGHARLVASHYVDNPASGRVLRKLGFLPTGKTENRMSMGRGEKVQATAYVLNLDTTESLRAA